MAGKWWERSIDVTAIAAGYSPTGSSHYVHQLHRLPEPHLQDVAAGSRQSVSKDSSPDKSSDEADAANTIATTTRRPNGDSGAIATARRSRGRPPGSKNKPKTLVVARDNPNALRSHVMEVSSGEDIVGSLSRYARRKGRGICIMSGGGSVTNVTLRQPAAAAPEGSIATLQGRFEILTLTGTVLPPPAPTSAGGLSIFLSGSEGQVVGGTVVGKLVALGPVVLMAASFSNAIYERLPLAPDEEKEGQGQASVQVQQKSASQSSEETSGGGGNEAGNGVTTEGGRGRGRGGVPLFHVGVGVGDGGDMGSFPYSSDHYHMNMNMNMMAANNWGGDVGRPPFN